ncbi:MAG: aspartate kinase [Phycisphaerae bacterium]
MGLIVQKFGGTSVGDAELIHRAARRAIRAKAAGDRVVLVVSAMGRTTDRLLDQAYQITDRPSRRELDQLLSTGEQVSVALTAMAIQHLEHDAISLTGGQIGLRTDHFYGRARIREITELSRIRRFLDEGKIVIVAGFQGVDPDFNVTTLGRGGSDTTAVALAAALKADECEIYTDVDGVYTTDPRIVPEARKLDEISYDEMLELSSLGAQVMHSRSIELGKNYDVRIHVRSSLTDAEGTLIVKETADMEQVIVRGAALRKNLARIVLDGVPNAPGSAAGIFSAVAARGIMVDDIVQLVGPPDGSHAINFTIDANDAADARALIDRFMHEFGVAAGRIDDNVAKLSVVGVGMRTHSGVASRLFAALREAEVNIENISTSEIVISCIIRREDGEKALRAAHAAFDLDQSAIEPQQPSLAAAPATDRAPPRAISRKSA